MVLLIAINASACNHFSKRTNEVRFDYIQPDDSDYACMSDNLVDKLLKHNCKINPDDEACPDD